MLTPAPSLAQIEQAKQSLAGLHDIGSGPPGQCLARYTALHLSFILPLHFFPKLEMIKKKKT